MKVRFSILVLIAFLDCRAGYAQEVTVDYSYVHANPQNNNIIPTFSPNGGGGSVVFYLNKYVVIEAEFEGYGSYTG